MIHILGDDVSPVHLHSLITRSCITSPWAPGNPRREMLCSPAADYHFHLIISSPGQKLPNAKPYQSSLASLTSEAACFLDSRACILVHELWTQLPSSLFCSKLGGHPVSEPPDGATADALPVQIFITRRHIRSSMHRCAVRTDAPCFPGYYTSLRQATALAPSWVPRGQRT